MIPKKFSKIFTVNILSLLVASVIIPIAHASGKGEEAISGNTSSYIKRVSTSQPLETYPKTAIPLRRAVSAPGYGSADRNRLLTEEPIPAPSVMVKRSPSIPKRREIQLAQDIAGALMDDAAEDFIPFSQPVAGFIPLSGHQCSQVDDSNTEAALARLEIDIMKGRILPEVERLLEHSWDEQPAATLSIKDELVAVMIELKAGRPQQASVLSTALISKVNEAERAGPLDEFSRLSLYSVQTVLHLLAGTPYIALNNFLELRQLGISWDSSSLLIQQLFRAPGNFYKNLTDFVSSDKADSIWADDARIRKLWQGHAQFAWDQHEFREISERLEGLGDAAGAEGELTFRHTCYVLGKMQLRFGEHSYDATLLKAAYETLQKINGYHFEGLFSYRIAATKVFLGDAAWAMHKLENPSVHLHEALIRYKDALSRIIADNETGAAMIRSSFDHAKGVITEYTAAPEDVIAKTQKIANLAMFREELKKLPSSLPHIDIPGLIEVMETELGRLVVVDASPKPIRDAVAAPQKKKKSSKKRKDRDDYKEADQRDDYEDSGRAEDYFDLRYSEYQQPPAKKQ